MCVCSEELHSPHLLPFLLLLSLAETLRLALRVRRLRAIDEPTATMQVDFAFGFQHTRNPVAVRVFVPQPERRPRTVVNFMFMCTGELPPPDLLDALRVPRSDVAYQTREEASAAGLKPFGETAVVRVERRVMIEIGGSASTSVFGSFIPDEPLGEDCLAAASLSQLKAGTVLCGNVGMPNSHASRYYILLADVAEKEKAQYAGQAPLGMVTSGLEQLAAAANSIAVRPRSLEPLKRVKVAVTQLEFRYQSLLAAGSTGSGNDPHHPRPHPHPHPPPPRVPRAAPPQREVVDVQRISGRVRRREDDEEADEQRGDDAEDGEAPEKKGFFRFDARFHAGGGGSGQGPAAKRLRTESAVVGMDEDGLPIPRTTAIEDESLTTVEDAHGAKRFDYFKAQEAAFLNDIDMIQQKQQQKTFRRMNRMSKHSSSSGSYGTQSSRKIRERAFRSQQSRTTKPKAASAIRGRGRASLGSSGRREVRKRY